ncbi:hypothetical protein EJ110_NYTH14717 [Nymphaea thermarum]|nr:hypothetical protein EJ110_NYTH14717 [Nymphaea thermarum]
MMEEGVFWNTYSYGKLVEKKVLVHREDWSYGPRFVSFRIGQDPRCNIILRDVSIMGYHCEIKVDKVTQHIRIANRTQLGRLRAAGRILHLGEFLHVYPGEVIQIRDMSRKFVLEEISAPKPVQQIEEPIKNDPISASPNFDELIQKALSKIDDILDKGKQEKSHIELGSKTTKGIVSTNMKSKDQLGPTTPPPCTEHMSKGIMGAVSQPPPRKTGNTKAYRKAYSTKGLTQEPEVPPTNYQPKKGDEAGGNKREERHEAIETIKWEVPNKSLKGKGVHDQATLETPSQMMASH